MKLQWYPGHMTRAKRAIQEDLKLIDLVIELRDARAVRSSGNPDIRTLSKGKYRLVLLGKADLAEEAVTSEWIRYFKEQGTEAAALDLRSGGEVRRLQQLIDEVCREKYERDARRGILSRPVRAMVVGIPNVGKSTFINSFAGKAAAKTGNKPGVTKGNQWIRLSKKTELLDTPGILWPKFDDEQTGTHLAFLGSVNDEIIDLETLAFELISELTALYPGLFGTRYGIEEQPDVPAMMEQAALRLNALKKGGEPDLLKTSRRILDDFRSGKCGRISLERPGKEQA